MIGQRLLINKMMTRDQRDIFGIYTVVVDSYPPIFAQCHPEETILTLDCHEPYELRLRLDARP